MELDKLFSDIKTRAQERGLGDIADSIITLFRSKKRVYNLIIQEGKETIAEEYRTDLEELLMAASQFLLGDNRPDEKEMKELIS